MIMYGELHRGQRKRSWQVSTYYLGIHLEGTRKTTKNHTSWRAKSKV